MIPQGEKFEDLPVWQESLGLAKLCLKLAKEEPIVHHTELAKELERRVIMIGNEIADGFEQGSNRDLLHKLYQARGSNAAVRSMLLLAMDLPDAAPLREELQASITATDACSQQLSDWATKLQKATVSHPPLAAGMTIGAPNR